MLYRPIVWKMADLGYCGLIFPSWSNVTSIDNTNNHVTFTSNGSGGVIIHVSNTSRLDFVFYRL